MKELSKSNEYYLPAERTKELEWFCKQYKRWGRAIDCVDGMSKVPKERMDRFIREHGDPTARAAETRAYYSDRMDMVRQAAYESGDSITAPIIFAAVTKGLDYDKLRAQMNVPICRKTFYALRRRFFWNLSALRG